MFGHWHGFAWFGVLPRSGSHQFPQRQCFWRSVNSPHAYKTDRPLRYRFQFLPFLPHLKRPALVPSRIVNNLEKLPYHTAKPALSHSFQWKNQHRIKEFTTHDAKHAQDQPANQATSRPMKISFGMKRKRHNQMVYFCQGGERRL